MSKTETKNFKVLLEHKDVFLHLTAEELEEMTSDWSDFEKELFLEYLGKIKK